MDVAAHRLAGKWYNMHLNMSGEMHMLRRAHAVMMRYSAAYPMGAERCTEGLLCHGVSHGVNDNCAERFITDQ